MVPIISSIQLFRPFSVYEIIALPPAGAGQACALKIEKRVRELRNWAAVCEPYLERTTALPTLRWPAAQAHRDRRAALVEWVPDWTVSTSPVGQSLTTSCAKKCAPELPPPS